MAPGYLLRALFTVVFANFSEFELNIFGTLLRNRHDQASFETRLMLSFKINLKSLFWAIMMQSVYNEGIKELI